MPRLSSRTVRSHTTVVRGGMRPAGAPDHARPRSPIRADTHKQHLMEALIACPEGMSADALAERIEVGGHRARALLTEMREQGLVTTDGGGPGKLARWFAEV